MSSDDFASKAQELRRRAAEAPTDSLRALYLRGADSYDSLARGPVARTAGAGGETVEALKAEIADLREHVVALENSLTISLALLRRLVPGLNSAVAQVNVEPHPDTAPERIAALKTLSRRVRGILGQPPEPATDGAPSPKPPVDEDQ